MNAHRWLPVLLVVAPRAAPAPALTKDEKDLKIAECVSRHLNETFRPRRNDADLGVGIIADPHCNDPNGYRTMSRMNVWHAESLHLTIIVGDLSAGKEDDLKKYVVDAPKNFAWPYTGTHQTVQAGKRVKRSWPDKPRPAPPCVLAFGNHEVHLGKRYYVELLWPGAVTDESLWIHDKAHYFNKAPGPNGNGNYVFFSFDFGRLHFVALDAWGMGRKIKPNTIPPHQMKWLQADLQAHREKETVILNHSPVVTGDPHLQLRDRLALMSVLKRHPQVKWYFSGHHHGYEWVKWAHLNVFRTCAGEAGRYGSGGLLVKADRTDWRVWNDHYWYAPDFWKDKKRVMYHRVLWPDKPSRTLDVPIPDARPADDKTPPPAPTDLRLRPVDPKRYVANSIPLRWTPADGADYYDVHRDGKRIGGSIYPYFTDYDRRPGAKHAYAVHACDLAGNRSPNPAAATFAAPAPTPRGKMTGRERRELDQIPTRSPGMLA